MSNNTSEDRVRIVHLEDDPGDKELVHETLAAGDLNFSVHHVATRAAFTAALQGGPIDLILSDFALPAFDGLSALAIARELRPDVPFVLVSGTMGEEAAIESLRNGATDYVLKHRLSRLVPAVRRALEEAAERKTRRDAEVSLAHERGFLLALLDSLEVGVVACDDHGRLTLLNQATRELYGFPPGPVSNEEWRAKPRLLTADGKTPLSPDAFPLNRALNGEELRNVEIAIRHEGGSLRAVLVGGRPIIDETGGKLGAVVALHDVTERKELEQRFRQSQKMEAMGALAAGVAHDFNNVLTAIMGYGESLRARLRPGSEELADTEEVLSAAGRAAQLTRQLLAFTRQQVLDPRVLNLNEVIQDVDKMLRRVIGEDVDLLTVAAADLGRVKADPGQLEQVLMNLAVNARDAMEAGGQLTIETANVDLEDDYASGRPDVKPGPYVMLAVTDTGCGMDADVASRIFEPFFTTKGVGKGTGLGLSTVHGIVKQSGGHTEVYSELGQGTTFKIYLPRVEAAVESKHGPLPDPGRHEGNETILLVEDEASIRRVLRQSLQLRGYTVLDVSDGSEAIGVLERSEQRVDLMVTDVVMPLMSGPKLAERVARMRPGLRTLFISGYTDHALVHQGLRREGSAFLQKPFSPDLLARKIREVLDGARRRAA